MNKILNGKELAEKKFITLQKRYKAVYNRKKSKHFHLVIIQIGDDEASNIYINNKKKYFDILKVKCTHKIYPDNLIAKELISELLELSKNEDVDGIFIQLPLPEHIDREIINLIPLNKDVDGFTDYNLGRMFLKQDCIIPATPKGIMSMLDEYNIDISGKDVLIINRSDIVGKPLAHLLLNRNATVTIAHSKTKKLNEKIKNADIVITGTGKKDIINMKTPLKEGVVLIDVGIIRENGKVRGDIHPDVVSRDEVRYISPVPNGVGAMTTISLIENLIQIYER